MTTAAFAVKPKAGFCWGTCGGQQGPVGGYFVVSHNQVEYFAISEACLGRVGADNASINSIPNMRVSNAGKFSFAGKARRATETGSASVKVVLKGTFVTSTKAEVSLKISYGHCGTKHATIVRHG